MPLSRNAFLFAFFFFLLRARGFVAVGGQDEAVGGWVGGTACAQGPAGCRRLRHRFPNHIAAGAVAGECGAARKENLPAATAYAQCA
jgi:hypothetical protein